MKSIIAGLIGAFAASTVFAADTNLIAVIPRPQKIELRDGAFNLTADTRIYVDSSSRATAQFLTGRLRPSTGYALKVSRKRFGTKAALDGIFLTTENANTNLGREGYELTVEPRSVVIRAPTQAGVFYGVQTLLQLLPPEVFSSNRVQDVAWQIPCMQIEDWPRFQWRGLLFNVSRHFFNKSEVEMVLDQMALHKLNTFHWHLTDDQGWRIEIKKYPKLTQIGAWRSSAGFGFDPKASSAYGPDGRYGGFYTQDDIREVIKYAAARHITIVPEIEMPGHATAALTAYPQYSCTGGPFGAITTAGVFNGIYDPSKEETFQFLAGVLSEVARLFPGQYIHIGGDEVKKDTWKTNAACQALIKREGLKNEDELQSWFTRRIEKIVESDGHSMIGWSEILQGGLPSNAAVMDWIGGAKEAASAGHYVVMTPTAYCYFDFYQSTNKAAEPEAADWGGPLPLNKMYSFDPMPANMPPQLQRYILGAQGNLWTERIPNLRHAEYMLYPRACALAEVTWSAPESRDWDDFMRRLRVHVRRFDELNINYRHAAVETPEPNLLK